MKTSSHSIERKDKILGDSKTCKRWLVWFRYNINGNIEECCGSNAWYPIRGSIGINYIEENLKSSNAYKYKPKDAEFYRIWAGTILNGNYITGIKTVK